MCIIICKYIFAVPFRAAPTGISRSIKKVLQSKVPDLGDLEVNSLIYAYTDRATLYGINMGVIIYLALHLRI